MHHRVEWYDGGVVYVDVFFDAEARYKHRLQGMDHYWVHPPFFGAFNTTDQYKGSPVVTYCVDGDNEARLLGEVTPFDLGLIPEILDGVMLSDDVAREYGLL